MNHRTLWKLSALSLTLSAPAALADWREGGSLRLQDDIGYDEDAQREEDGGYEGAGEVARGGGFSLGLRAGYGVPFGKVSDTGDEEGGEVSDAVSGVIPLQLDVGYFFNSRLYLGGFFQYGLGQLAEDCPDGASCSASQLRFGVNLAYHFNATEKLDPWVGVGVGYESLGVSVSAEEDGATAKVSSSITGLEFASLQGGLDYRVSKTFSVGPFITYTVGQYSSITTRLEAEGGGIEIDEEESTDIEEKAIHSWLYGGVRVQARF